MIGKGKTTKIGRSTELGPLYGLNSDIVISCDLGDFYGMTGHPVATYASCLANNVLKKKNQYKSSLQLLVNYGDTTIQFTHPTWHAQRKFTDHEIPHQGTFCCPHLKHIPTPRSKKVSSNIV